MKRYCFDNHSSELEEDTIPLIKIRDFRGYLQYLDTMPQGNIDTYCWRFCITGFTFDNKHGHILMSNKTEEIIAIDDNNYICINKAYYGRRYWNH